MSRAHHGVLHSLTLLTSFSTLLCCALPALFVALGAGAVLAGIVSTIPQLIWLSEHKFQLFIFSGVMLGCSGSLRYRSRQAPCPMEPERAAACTQARRWSGVVYGVSLLLYTIGMFFAFIAPYLRG